MMGERAEAQEALFYDFSLERHVPGDHLLRGIDCFVDLSGSRAIRQAEVGSARTMIARTQDRFGLWPARLAADSAYGSAEKLARLGHQRGVEPHIPVVGKA